MHRFFEIVLMLLLVGSLISETARELFCRAFSLAVALWFVSTLFGLKFFK